MMIRFLADTGSVFTSTVDGGWSVALYRNGRHSIRDEVQSLKLFKCIEIIT